MKFSSHSPVELLEDTVHLLREAPLSAIVCHSTGSIPFAFAVLRFWSDITNPRTSDFSCALEALGLALTLVWMNCWRAIFAARLRCQLAGSSKPPWNFGRLWRLGAAQAFFGGTKLLVLPVASLVMFPLPPAVAFYRYAAVLSGSGEHDIFEVISRARRPAGLESRQNWGVLLILGFLWLAVFVNLTIMLAVLPQIVRILTGYESVFSRGGSLWIRNPLFVILAFAVSWIAFDPFIQAVYCVRLFRAESMETGEDLRAGLRTLSAGGIPGSAVLLALFVAALPAHGSVTPADLEKSVRRTMQSHEYDWRIPPPPPAATQVSWLVRLADHMVAGVKAVTRAAGRALSQFLRWLFGDRFAAPDTGALPSSGLHWSVYVLLAAVILFAGWIVWRRRRARRAVPSAAGGPGIEPVRLDAEDLTPDRLPEESWLDLSERYVSEENYRLALRALYLANLAWLGRRELISIHPGKTNREYQVELRRRARAILNADSLFAGNVSAFERAWYGMHYVGAGDISQFRSRIDEMKRAAA